MWYSDQQGKSYWTCHETYGELVWVSESSVLRCWVPEANSERSLPFKQSVVRNGDEVEIKVRHKVIYDDSPKGFGVTGETVGLVIKDLVINDMKEGDVVEGV